MTPSKMTDSPGVPVRYAWQQSYEWNFQHSPSAAAATLQSAPCKHQFLGLPVASPLGIAAGPLLNGRWILHYASLGFDVLTYKTVRRIARDCYPQPNLVPIQSQQVEGLSQQEAQEEMAGSWAISFGMPSQPPEFWMQDIRSTRQQLPRGKLLSVSVVATPGDDATFTEIQSDYVQCALWAAESGADTVELNFSCPNVDTADGQLYAQPTSAGCIASAVRQSLPKTPLAVKIGHLTDPRIACDLVEALAPHVDALSMTNCIPAVIQQNQRLLFAGQPRGIGGDAILEASLRQVEMFSQAIDRSGSAMKIIGVGGIGSPAAAQRYLQAGADAIQLATAAMIDPFIGREIKELLQWY